MPSRRHATILDVAKMEATIGNLSISNVSRVSDPSSGRKLDGRASWYNNEEVWASIWVVARSRNYRYRYARDLPRHASRVRAWAARSDIELHREHWQNYVDNATIVAAYESIPSTRLWHHTQMKRNVDLSANDNNRVECASDVLFEIPFSSLLWNASDDALVMPCELRRGATRILHLCIERGSLRVWVFMDANVRIFGKMISRARSSNLSK